MAIPPETPAGSYFIIVVADAGQVIGESNETNNALAKPIEILPDLRVTVLSAPSKAFPGTTISVTDTTRNQGAGAGISTTTFFLSVDATLDAGDLVLGSRAVPVLAFNENSTGLDLGGHPGRDAGRHLLPHCVGGFWEARSRRSNETNNTRTRTLTIGPDLIVSIALRPLVGRRGGDHHRDGHHAQSGLGGGGLDDEVLPVGRQRPRAGRPGAGQPDGSGPRPRAEPARRRPCSRFRPGRRRATTSSLPSAMPLTPWPS